MMKPLHSSMQLNHLLKLKPAQHSMENLCSLKSLTQAIGT